MTSTAAPKAVAPPSRSSATTEATAAPSRAHSATAQPSSFTAGSDAGIDVVQSEYATIAAENTALERLSQVVADEIVARVALYARRQPR